jgi:hypothetical protein
MVVIILPDVKSQPVNILVIRDVRFSYTLYGIFFLLVVNRHRNNLCDALRTSETGGMIMYCTQRIISLNYASLISL